MPNAKSVRAILDINVVLSGLFWRGPPHTLLNYIRDGTLTLVSSPDLLAELADVIERPKFDTILVRSDTSRKQSLIEIRELAVVITPKPLATPVCRDADDDAVLALALAGQVDLIVSGDADLLTLQEYQGIRIVNPAVGVALIEQQK